MFSAAKLKHILFFSIFFFLFFSYARGQLNYTAQNNKTGVDFLIDWAADSYIPQDYEGKALPTYGSKITLSATPLSIINENDYEFIWLIDLTTTANNNKKSVADFTIKKRSGEHNVFLTIRDIKNKKIIKESSLSIPIFTPQTITYKKNQYGHLIPLSSYQDISNTINKGGQLDLIAKSFYFTKIKNLSSLNYNWQLNEDKIESPDVNPYKLSIEFPTEIPSGHNYNLSLSIENPLNEFQFSEKKYKIVVK